MRGALLGFAAAITVMVGLVVLDSKATNWFVPDAADVNAGKEDLEGLERRVRDAEAEIRGVEYDVAQLESRTGDEGYQAALARLAQMWATKTWAERRMESVSFDDPAVTACVDYVVTGKGSFVECGFQRMEP